MPIKGPGKFEGETYAVRFAYENPDDDFGESDGFGWYGRFSGTIKGRGPFHIIVTENSQGFVSGAFYDSEELMMDAYSELETDYADEAEAEDEDYE